MDIFSAVTDRIIAALEKAKQYNNVSSIAVEETKLSALEDIAAHFREVSEA